jgi:hypothetical protein
MSNGVTKVEDGLVSQAGDDQAPIETTWGVDPNGENFVQDLIDAVSAAITSDFSSAAPTTNPEFYYTLSRLKRRC